MRKHLKTALTVTSMMLSSFTYADTAQGIRNVDISGGEAKWQTHTVNSHQDTLDLFASLDYTEANWLAGDRAVPRVYLANIPKKWSKETSKEITVQLKKKMFFRTLGPLVLRSNELILQDRARLQAVQASLPAIAPDDQQWFTELCAYYRSECSSDASDGDIEQLLLKVDSLPPSLIIAQAAEESGWGTSRFAFSGNALFGQWTWGDEGITPEQQRSGMGDYKIASFATPLQSVQAHARNLNTHPAYAELRELRAQKHAAGEVLTGEEAATKLTKYSERGADYVKTLHSIIRYNKLQAADTAYLKNMTAIVLLPVAE